MTQSDLYDQTIQECFMGEVYRDCNGCVASPAQGGRCCFGEAYNAADKECRDCIHRSECSATQYGTTVHSPRVTLRRPMPQPMAPRRIPVTGPQPINRPVGNLIPNTVNRAPVTAMAPTIETSPEPFMRRLGRVTGWGMIEGGLQMALGFFQRNRPD